MSVVAATTAAAAMVLLIAVIAVFLAFVLCFYLFLCAKRYNGATPTIGTGNSRSGSRFFFFTSSSSSATAPVAGFFCQDRGIDDKTIAASLPATLVKEGGADCAVCLSEVIAGEMARLLPRCGHGFHVECLDVWLRSHSTCPLCRCPVIAELSSESCPSVVQLPEADPESPNFPTNVLFFGSQDDVSTGGGGGASIAGDSAGIAAVEGDVAVPGRIRTIRRLLGRGGGSPVAVVMDVEMGMGGGPECSLSPTSPAAKTPAGS